MRRRDEEKEIIAELRLERLVCCSCFSIIETKEVLKQAEFGFGSIPWQVIEFK